MHLGLLDSFACLKVVVKTKVSSRPKAPKQLDWFSELTWLGCQIAPKGRRSLSVSFAWFLLCPCAPFCSDTTNGKPKGIPSEGESYPTWCTHGMMGSMAVHANMRRTRWLWSCQDAKQLYRSRNTIQGCGRRELFQLP